MSSYDVVSTFAGPGGWCEGLRLVSPDLHARHVGVELDPVACATREAAGHATIRGDVRALDPAAFRGAQVLISSPPCPTFSTAGRRSGLGPDFQAALDSITCWGIGCGCDWESLPARVQDVRTALVVEPMRWIEVMEPDCVILEQVPAAEYIWEDLAAELYADGWAVADVRVVDAADYGVPQHRRRAVLTAARYGYGSHLDPGPLWGPRGPYVTPADVLGLDGVLGFARRNDRPDGAAYRVRDMRPTSRPAFTLTEKVRSWTYAPADGSLARQLTVPEVSAPMSFPPDYPWAGSRSRACLQAANAVPPLMAAHLLAGLLGLPAPALARSVETAAADLAACGGTRDG